MLIGTGEPPASPIMMRVIGMFRKAFVKSFVARIDRATTVAALPYAAELHLCDGTLSDAERIAVADLVRSARGGGDD